MIGYLTGKIIRYEADGILLLAGHIGYEILLSPTTLEQLKNQDTQQADSQEDVSLEIYYHVTERQPKPVLIGFTSPEEKGFFQLFITVAAIGPMKAIKAMTRPSGEIALAIEQKDVQFLSGLAGIGKRTAEKIIATLRGKVEPFVAGPENPKDPVSKAVPEALTEACRQVEIVLVEQLGHSSASARRMIREALERDPDIRTPESLFDEIYREDES